jgi:pilus assembly protein Flp/PilA
MRAKLANWRETTMALMLRSLFFHLKTRFSDEQGQDLVEYALIVALLSFCAVATMQNVATSIAAAYNNLAVTFSGDV